MRRVCHPAIKFTVSFLNIVLWNVPDLLWFLWVNFLKFRGKRVELSADFENRFLLVEVEVNGRTYLQFLCVWQFPSSVVLMRLSRKNSRGQRKCLVMFSKNKLIRFSRQCQENQSSIKPAAAIGHGRSCPFHQKRFKRIRLNQRIKTTWEEFNSILNALAFTCRRIKSASCCFFCDAVTQITQGSGPQNIKSFWLFGLHGSLRILKENDHGTNLTNSRTATGQTAAKGCAKVIR